MKYSLKMLGLDIVIFTLRLHQSIQILFDKKKIVDNITDEAFVRIHPDLMRIIKKERRAGAFIEYLNARRDDTSGKEYPERIIVRHTFDYSDFYNLETGELTY